jgi:hypothetical protein
MAKQKRIQGMCLVCSRVVVASKNKTAYCVCGAVFHVECDKQAQRCPDPTCYMRLIIRSRKEIEIEVSGTDAKEVEKVSSSILTHTKSDHLLKPYQRSPWSSGLFYLFAAVILLAAVLVVARIVPIIILPIALVFAALSLSIIGALQLRQDNQLSEKGFLILMLQRLKSLPLLRQKENVNGGKSLE